MRVVHAAPAALNTLLGATPPKALAAERGGRVGGRRSKRHAQMPGLSLARGRVDGDVAVFVFSSRTPEVCRFASYLVTRSSKASWRAKSLVWLASGTWNDG